MVRIRDSNDTSAWYPAAKGIGPGVAAARCVVGYQSGFAGRITGRKAVPVVRTSVDREHGNRNVGDLLHAEGHGGPDRRSGRYRRQVRDLFIALMKNDLEPYYSRFKLQ
jgi:hypothetical protein